MKFLTFQGKIIIDKDKVENFKNDLKKLIDKYSISILSRSAKIQVVTDLSYTHNNKYKPGAIFRLNTECEDNFNFENSDCYFLFLAVDSSRAITLALSFAELDYIISRGSKDTNIFENLLGNSIQFFDFDRVNFLTRKVLNKDIEYMDIESCQVKWSDIDFNLEYIDSINNEIIANLYIQFRIQTGFILPDAIFS